MSLLLDHGFVHRMVSVLQEHFAAHEGSGGLRAGHRHFAADELAALPQPRQADTLTRDARRSSAAFRPLGVPWLRAGRAWQAVGQAGFAVVDLAPDLLRVRHVDENGEVYADETI